MERLQNFDWNYSCPKDGQLNINHYQQIKPLSSKVSGINVFGNDLSLGPSLIGCSLLFVIVMKSTLNNGSLLVPVLVVQVFPFL